jgi:ADP-heptose:LPS heptosyltransferase
VKLVIRAPMTGLSGYAHLSRAVVTSLSEQTGVEIVALQPMTWEPDQSVPVEFMKFTPLINVSVDPAECVLLQISLPTEFNTQAADTRPWKRRVGYTMLETDRITPHWVSACNTMDAIVTPSTFNKKTFETSGVAVPVHTINPGIDWLPRAELEQLRRGDVGKQLLSFCAGRFVFHAAGQWSPPQGRSRKGLEELLEAYFSAFSVYDAVGLILRTTCTGDGVVGDRALVVSKIEDVRRRMGRKQEECAPLLLLHGRIPDADCEAAWAVSDAFVLPTHGEGWGLDFVRAATLGMPIAAPRWSGLTDFLEGSSGVRWIPHTLGGVSPEIAFYSRGAIQADHQWAEMGVPDIAEALVDIRANASQYLAGAAEHQKLLKQRTWERSTEELVKVLGTETILPMEAEDAILVVQPISLGDVYMVSAVVDGLKKKHPHTAIDVMTKKRCQCIWEGNPNVRKVLNYPDPFYNPLWREAFDKLPNAAALRRQYRKVYTPYHVTQIDFSRVQDWWREGKHIIEVYAAECELTPPEIGKPFIQVQQPSEIVVRGRERYGRPWVVIHPQTGAPNKMWGGFPELVRRIREEQLRAVIQVGGPNDSPILGVDKMVTDVHEAAWCMGGDRAVAFVGVDSLMGHIASTTIPTISIFGGTEETFSFPYWGHGIVMAPSKAQRACAKQFACHADICQYGKACIETITVDDVMKALKPLL